MQKELKKTDAKEIQFLNISNSSVTTTQVTTLPTLITNLQKIAYENSLEQRIGKFIVSRSKSTLGLLSLPFYLLKCLRSLFSHAPKELGGKNFSTLLETYDKKGLDAAKSLLLCTMENKNLSSVVVANAYAALARHIKLQDSNIAIELQYFAYENNPSNYHLKWLAFHYFDAKKYAAAKAILKLLPKDDIQTNFEKKKIANINKFKILPTNKKKSKVTLVVIYNHNYEENVEKIEKILKNKFEKIYHLMPFDRGNKKNVIKIYGTSYLFHDYIRQGLPHFRDKDSSHYVFIGDDLLLNPSINEDNILEKLNLSQHDFFISSFSSITPECYTTWPWTFPSTRNLEFNHSCKWQSFVPSQEEAFARFKKHGLNPKRLSRKGFHLLQSEAKLANSNYYCYNTKNIVVQNKLTKLQNPSDCMYPLARAYSDFIVVPASHIDDYCHLLGVFASANLFVELAIPTSMLLCAERIKTFEDTNLEGNAIWGQARSSFNENHDMSLESLYKNFHKTLLYIHPVKLSQWK